MKTKETKALLSESNKRLVIMGKFNSSGCQSDARRGVTFSGRARLGYAKLGVADLFERIAPELRFARGESIKIGNTIFNSYRLMTPVETGERESHAQPITDDSPLLEPLTSEGTATASVRWQRQGGKLLQDLLSHLDDVARFGDGRFFAALLKLTRRFAVDYADSLSHDDKIDRAEWEELAFDHPISAALVAYMACYRSDEANALSSVRKALAAYAEAPDAPLTTARIERLARGLEQCKRVLEAGHEDDPYLQVIGKDQQYRYLADYPSSKYGISVPRAGAKGFVSHYRHFRACSDAVHRFVRNGALHSYLFLWLAGKYGAYESPEDIPALAREMFVLGIEGQGDKRIPGETTEERARNFEIVRSTESALSEAQRAELQRSPVYDRLQQVLEQGILEKLRPDRAFRRDALSRRNRELFVSLGQLAGGKAGQLVRHATELAGELSRAYRTAKNVRCAEGEVLSAEVFAKAFRRLRAGDHARTIDALIEEVGALGLAGEALRERVCAAVVRLIAKEAKTYFDRSWAADLDAIDQEIQTLGDVYALRNKLDVERGADDTRGMPMTVLTAKEIAILAPVEPSDHDRSRYTQSLQRAASAADASKLESAPRVPLAVPARLEQAAQSGQRGVIKSGAGTPLAELSSEPERGIITATLAPNVAPEQLLSRDVRVDFGELKDLKVVEIEGLDLEPLAKSQELRAQELRGTADRFGSYSTTQALIRERYVSDRSEHGDTHFTRAARALALGEYLAAAPASESNLGIADLSNMLGVVLDIVEQLADVDDAKTYRDDFRVPADVLGRINLSQHYPVNDASELSRVLQYHHAQCGALAGLDQYFSELRSIKALFHALEGNEAEITVYNCTLAEHAALDYPGELFVVREHPVAAYLTAQAVPTPSSLQSFSRQITDALTHRDDDTLTLQLPLLITPATLPETGAPLPVISPATVLLPALAQSGTDGARRGDVIPCTQSAIDIYLCLATALVMGAGGPELGQLERLSKDQRNTARDLFHEGPQEGQSLAALLRRAWFALGSPLTAKLCTSRWLNICLLHDPQTPEHLRDLLTSNCLLALKEASNEKNTSGEYLGASAFDGLGLTSVTECASYMPQAFTGAAANPTVTSLASQPNAIGLACGALGIRERTGKKSQNFGELAFLTTLNGAVTGGARSAPVEDPSSMSAGKRR